MTHEHTPRRSVLLGLAASGILGTGATSLSTAQETTTRVTPPVQSITVQPETSILFEVDPRNESDGFGPEWLVDDDTEGTSIGPWYSAYYDHNDHEFWQYEVDADCEVTADLDPESTNDHTTTWEIQTSPDGLSEPSIEETRPPADEDRDLVDGETHKCEVEVTDRDGNLNRVVWWALASDYVIEETSISGSEDTASIAPESSEIVPEGVVAWVISESGAYVSSDRWEFNRHTDGSSFSVSDVQTNSAIEGGETLEAQATIENTGDKHDTTDVGLIVGHDPELVDTETVELHPNGSTEVTLTFNAGTPSGGRESFPGEISTEDDSIEFTIIVEDDGDPAPAEFQVTNISTNSPVGGGETLIVETTIENVGGEEGRTDTELIVGHSPVTEDSAMHTLDPGESTTFTLSFQAGQPTGNREEFPVVVDTGADTDSESVVVE